MKVNNMCDEKCSNDANCFQCACSAEVQEKRVMLKKISFEIDGVERSFEIAKTSLMSDDYEPDVCDACVNKGLGKYIFDLKHGVCDFAMICSHPYLGDSDRLYLKEVQNE
jgi:hypothetical protein